MSRITLIPILVFALAACSGTETQEDSNPYAPITAELIAMSEADQDLRSRILESMNNSPDRQPDQELGAEMIRVDQVNRERLKEIIAEYGWPRVSDFGKQAAHSAWLIAQHADLDPAFQADVLDMIEPLVKLGEIEKQDYGLLVDRVLSAQGKPQRYGTQYSTAMVEGEMVFHPKTPIEDLENLDARRAEMGMIPHADYMARMREVYGAQARVREETED